MGFLSSIRVRGEKFSLPSNVPPSKIVNGYTIRVHVTMIKCLENMIICLEWAGLKVLIMDIYSVKSLLAATVHLSIIGHSCLQVS